MAQDESRLERKPTTTEQLQIEQPTKTANMVTFYARANWTKQRRRIPVNLTSKFILQTRIIEQG